MYSWGVWTPQSEPNLKKIVLIKALQWLLILLFLYFFHSVRATKVFGTQHFSLFLSLPLCVCVCYTCVSIPGFKSTICFIFFLSLTVGKLSVLYTLLAVSSASAPLPSPQQSPISIWGSGVPGMLILLPPPDLVTILPGSLWLFLFLFRAKKTQSVSTGLQSLMQSSPVMPTSSPTASPPTLYSFTMTPLLFLKYARHFYVSQYAPTFRTSLTLCSVRIKQMKTDWVERFSPNPSFWLIEKRIPIQSD